MLQKPLMQKNRKYIDHLLQKYNLWQTGLGMMFLLQHHNWFVSVCLCECRIRLPCIMWWDICTAVQVSKSYIGVETTMDWMISLNLIEETVSHVGLKQDCWHDTTNLSCYGDQECRRQLHPALSTAEAEFYSASEIAVEIIYLCNLIKTRACHRRMIPLCMRITQHALNGKIISSVVVNVQSISISASTLHMKSFRTATCDPSRFQQKNSWLTSLATRYRFLSHGLNDVL